MATQHHDNRLTSRFKLAIVLVAATLLGGVLSLLSACQPGSINTMNTPPDLSNISRLYLVTVGRDGQTDKILSALNPGNGHIFWQHKLDDAVYGYGLSTQGIIYLPAQDGNVYAFQGSNGQSLWHSIMSHGHLESTSVWLLAYQNLIIDSITDRTNDNGDLYALNMRTGEVVWHTSITCADSPSNDCAAGGRITSLANGVIYGLADDGFSAWNAANGHFMWRNPHYQLNGQPQSMTVSHGKVYITNFYPEVDVLDATSGHFLHSLRSLEPSNSETVVYDITADENTVFVLGGQTVSAFRASDDTLLWKQTFSYHSGGTLYAGSGGVYVNYYDISMGKVGTGGSSGNDLYALHTQDGHQIWYQQIPIGGSNLYPIEFNGIICFGGLGSVYGLHLIDGKQLWQFSKGSYVDGLFAG